MPKEHIGRTITLEADKVYVVVSENAKEDFDFAVVDTLDYDNDDAKFLACLVRGMIANTIKNPEQTIDAGAAAFEKDNIKITENTPTTLDGFPKTIGNA